MLGSHSRWIAAAIALSTAVGHADSSVPPTGKRDTGPIVWQRDLKAASSDAQRRSRAVLIFFGAEWAMPCIEMKKKVFTQPEVAALIHERFVPVYIDCTDDQDEGVTKLRQQYKVNGLPTLIVIDRKGREAWRLNQFADAAEVLQRLSAIK
jgi:thiol:disulfide interchange protein